MTADITKAARGRKELEVESKVRKDEKHGS